jgi:hypothetical protein
MAVVDVVLLLLAVHFASFLGFYVLMRRSMCLSIAWKSVAKYIAASLVMGGLLLLIPSTSTLAFTIGKAIVGLCAYFALLLAIDKQTRILLNLVVEEIRVILRQLTHRGNGFQDEKDVSVSEN